MDGRVTQRVGDLAGLHETVEISGQDGTQKAGCQACAWHGVEHHPHLVLAECVAHPAGHIVVRMHLYRQVGFRIDELDQQWEPTAVLG